MVGVTWRKAIAAELARCYRPGQQFSLADFYAKAEARLQAMWPDNTTVRDTMRQVMQRLRDEGLLEFLGRGQYVYRAELGASVAQSGPERTPLALAAYELAARVTADTKVAASDYLAIARSRSPEDELRSLLTGAAGPTFNALFRVGRLDLSFERLVVDRAAELAIGRDLVRAAIERLDYYDAV